MPNLWVIFTTGLLTGGVTCLAVQGGLLATVMASRAGELESRKAGVFEIGSFLVAKLVAYTILGLGLGAIGSALVISPTALGVMQLLAAIYMLGVAGALLNIHPVFRYFIIQPPRFLTRSLRAQSKSKKMFAPIILGAMTVFIPCGTTQAVMALAIATAQPLAGAATMGVFVLGTWPLFALIGLGLSKIGDIFKSKFGKVAAMAVVTVALVNLNGSLVVLNSPVQPARMAKEVYCTFTFCREEIDLKNVVPVTELTININNLGYAVDHPVIKAGEQIKLNLKNMDGRGCQQAFTIPALGLSKVIGVGQTGEIEFTAPSTTGKLAFSCSMGMYTGELTVVN